VVTDEIHHSSGTGVRAGEIDGNDGEGRAVEEAEEESLGTDGPHVSGTVIREGRVGREADTLKATDRGRRNEEHSRFIVLMRISDDAGRHHWRSVEGDA